MHLTKIINPLIAFSVQISAALQQYFKPDKSYTLDAQIAFKFTFQIYVLVFSKLPKLALLAFLCNFKWKSIGNSCQLNEFEYKISFGKVLLKYN